MHVHCVCSGSEPEYTNSLKDFILGSRLEGGGRKQQVFSSLQGGNRNFLSSLGGNRCFSTYVSNFRSPPPRW